MRDWNNFQLKSILDYYNHPTTNLYVAETETVPSLLNREFVLNSVVRFIRMDSERHSNHCGSSGQKMELGFYQFYASLGSIAGAV